MRRENVFTQFFFVLGFQYGKTPSTGQCLFEHEVVCKHGTKSTARETKNDNLVKEDCFRIS